VKLRLGVVAGLVSVVVLTGCDSQMHPGAAAVVNGAAVSQSYVDDSATALCHLIVVTNEGAAQPSTPSISDLRVNFTSFGVQSKVVNAVVDELGLTINPSDVDRLTAQYALPDGLSEDDVDRLNAYLDELSAFYVSEATISAHAADPSVTDSSGLQVDASAPPPLPDEVTQRLADADVDVNPMYGSWDGSTSTVVAASGSLSELVSKASASPDPAAPEADSADLPSSQACG
jgi:hypothetical protein